MFEDEMKDFEKCINKKQQIIIDSIAAVMNENSYDEIPVQKNHADEVRNALKNFLDDKKNNPIFSQKQIIESHFRKRRNERELYIFLMLNIPGMKDLLNLIQQTHPELLNDYAVKDEDNLFDDYRFYMNDLLLLTDRSIQKICRELDNNVLAKALIGEPFLIKEKILNNLSGQAAQSLLNDIKLFSSSTSDEEIKRCQGIVFAVYYSLLSRKEVSDIREKQNSVY